MNVIEISPVFSQFWLKPSCFLLSSCCACGLFSSHAQSADIANVLFWRYVPKTQAVKLIDTTKMMMLIIFLHLHILSVFPQISTVFKKSVLKVSLLGQNVNFYAILKSNLYFLCEIFNLLQN